jgi:hypothetical protein
MSAARVDAGDGLLDPVVVVALGVLIANDHLLKAAAAHTALAPVTGKLSDVAGMIFFPVLCVAGLELAAARVLKRPMLPSVEGAVLVAVVVAAVFVGINVSDRAGDAYAIALGTIQWPVRGLWAHLHGAPWPALSPVAHVVDITDAPCGVFAAYVAIQTRQRRAWALKRLDHP